MKPLRCRLSKYSLSGPCPATHSIDLSCKCCLASRPGCKSGPSMISQSGFICTPLKSTMITYRKRKLYQDSEVEEFHTLEGLYCKICVTDSCRPAGPPLAVIRFTKGLNVLFVLHHIPSLMCICFIVDITPCHIPIVRLLQNGWPCSHWAACNCKCLMLEIGRAHV